MVGDTGIEPVTSSVSGKRATAAPIARCSVRSASFGERSRWIRDSNPCIRLCRPLPRLSANPPCTGFGVGGPRADQVGGTRRCRPDDAGPRTGVRADDEIRTRDPHLGKVMRYRCATSACRSYWCCLLTCRAVVLPVRRFRCPARPRRMYTTAAPESKSSLRRSRHSESDPRLSARIRLDAVRSPGRGGRRRCIRTPRIRYDRLSGRPARPPGRLAQLVARFLHTEEVIGSSPVSPTLTPGPCSRTRPGVLSSRRGRPPSSPRPVEGADPR